MKIITSYEDYRGHLHKTEQDCLSAEEKYDYIKESLPFWKERYIAKDQFYQWTRKEYDDLLLTVINIFIKYGDKDKLNRRNKQIDINHLKFSPFFITYLNYSDSKILSFLEKQLENICPICFKEYPYQEEACECRINH